MFSLNSLIKYISVLLLTRAALAQPLEERDVDVNVGTTHVHLGLGTSIQSGTAVALGCTKFALPGPVCWVAGALAALLAADIEITLGGESSGATKENAKRDYIPVKYLYNDSYVSYSIVTVPSHAIESFNENNITFGQALLATYYESSALTKRTIQEGHIIQFNSSYGQHIAADIGYRPIEDFMGNITSSSPVNDNHSKRGWDFDVDWLSYNFDNVNKGLAASWYDAYEYDNDDPKNVIQTELANYVTQHGAYKYCVSAIYSPDNVGSLGTGDSNEIQNAYHGELYFNTYGGVDGQCNDNYDCVYGCSGM
ncbi:similar to Saccharomyces cerevisiae YER187W Putative protein of unknown function [Maudiozyma saulgeensis]|uniref:Flo11 domain-containing protein n=1 Tax=Maudiozyma saulgeensis TaxID=1789683 RepID=A0A1X7QXL0_9SACH|nr:similar to Saccharomyces cerevisiae YER187W Putative protein of unknown function [Kazachstania saulgeensis]